MIIKAIKKFTFTKNDGETALARKDEELDLHDEIAHALEKYGYCKIGVQTKAIPPKLNKKIDVEKQTLNKAANE